MQHSQFIPLTPECEPYGYSEKSIWEMCKILAWIEPTKHVNLVNLTL